MILVEAGSDDDRGFDAKIVFSAQLAAHGHAVVIDENSLPAMLHRNQKYEVAPYLANIADVSISRVLLIGAEDISDATLMRLRACNLADVAAISAIGDFPDHQSLLGARARLAYALGREPQVVNLSDLHKIGLPKASIATQIRIPPPERPPLPTLFLFVPGERLDDPATLPILAAIDDGSAFRLTILTDRKGKEKIKESRFAGLSLLGYAELGPMTLARSADIAVFYGEDTLNERMSAFAVELFAAGKTVIDCTSTKSLLTDAPALRGPDDLDALPDYLNRSVVPNLEELGIHAQNSRWTASRSIERIEEAFGIPQSGHPGTTVMETRDEARTIFFPTNGNGLGHAQRCTLIAAEMDAAERIGFAAYPSCVGLIRGKGFACLPLVPKSVDH